MPEPKLQVICFSKDRPLQLHGYLTSFYRHCEQNAAVKVLVQSQPQWFADAYSQVEDEFSQVEFCHETDFRTDLESLIGDTEYTMFGCDDVVFTRSFETRVDPDVIGLSLRLGNHVTRDMFGNPLSQPAQFRQGNQWPVAEGVGDWGYPWEVLGTIYETDFVKRMVTRVQANSPSQLEERGSRCWSEETDKRMLSSWALSRLVVPTVNLVQQEFPNGICGNVPLDVGYLLDCWNHGMRLDIDRYANMAPESWRIPDFFLRRA
jgi:hypothetical protein